MTQSIYVDEFLFRGRPANSADAPAWHVQLGVQQDDGFGGLTTSFKLFNMADAEAAGWPLPAIISAINADTLKISEQLTVDKTALQATIATMQAAADESAASGQTAADAANAQISDLTAQLATAQTALAAAQAQLAQPSE